MADRVVKVKLTADISEYTASLVKAAAQARALGGDVERGIDRHVSPAMRRAGEKQGGILARGINNGLVRNSPLIAAGVAAALAAGAPVALAGATTLFAGIGAVAAAQSAGVREAWTEMGHEIRDGAVSDAAVLVPVYERMADKIGAAFQRMRPELRDAFEAAGPQIDQFSSSLTQAAENALPGLLRAVERGGPVIEGLGSLMESVGTGLSDFLDAMSDDSDAAGAALEGLGDVLGAALPLLGELLGTGSALASTVLPPLAFALGQVANIAGLLSPVLGPLAIGFGAFRLAGVVAPGVATLGTTLGILAMEGGRGAGAMDKAGRALHGLSSALPGIGIALAGVSAIMARVDQQGTEWAQALLAGGKAAETARAQMSDFGTAMRETNSGFEGVLTGLLGVGTQVGATAMALDQAEDKAREMYNAMSPLDQRTQDVTKAQNDLEHAVGKYGPASSQARAAQTELTLASARLAAEQGNLETALYGVTQAMLAQAEQALAAANSDLAYRLSVDATETAVSELTAAIAEHGAGSEEAADAADRVEQALLQQAAAARQSAFDTSTATSEAGKNAEADAAMLAELLQLREVMGASFPAALNTTIDRLLGSTNAGMVAAAQFRQLGLNILDVPNSKTIIVSSTTPEQVRQLEALGFTVRTLPDGRIEVTAATDAAEQQILELTRTRTATVVVSALQRGFGGLFGHDGGIVHAFANGGFEPMRGGIAQVVRPNTFRVIGDRVQDDEAYIPINGDARSHQILQQTAARMGYSMGRESSGASVSVSGPGIDYGRLAAAVASGGSGRPLVGTVVTQRNETGFELADRLAFTARTSSG